MTPHGVSATVANGDALCSQVVTITAPLPASSGSTAEGNSYEDLHPWKELEKTLP